MTTTRRPGHLPINQDPCVLRWELRRGPNALTCELDAHGDRSFDLQVLFGWCDTPALAEHFDNPVQAFERHAEVTSLLRDAGWVVAAHTPRGGVPLASSFAR